MALFLFKIILLVNNIDKKFKETYTMFLININRYRSQQDRDYQYCPNCNAYREFLWDRCVVCKGN